MVSTTRSLLLVALLATTQAFAPTTHLSQQQQQQQRQRQQQSARFDALEVVDDSAPEDPFAAYQPTAEQRAVVFKDSKIGSGYTVGDEPSQQLKIKYTATFLEPNPGAKFDFSENFICKTGQNKILPGFEEGLKGMSVGGKRTIKIPPNKGYGDQWYKGTIPPNAHLQFECELLGIDQTPQEEFMTALDNFGVGRAIGIAVCVGYLAASPFLNI